MKTEPEYYLRNHKKKGINDSAKIALNEYV